jgi:hypothetical protein
MREDYYNPLSIGLVKTTTTRYPLAPDHAHLHPCDHANRRRLRVRLTTLDGCRSPATTVAVVEIRSVAASVHLMIKEIRHRAAGTLSSDDPDDGSRREGHRGVQV